MTRFSFDDAELQAIATKIAPVAGWDRMANIRGEDIGYLEADDITCTDTPVAEWIAARGEPDRRGDVLVFTTRISIRDARRPGRSFEQAALVYVVEIPGGTAAYVAQ